MTVSLNGTTGIAFSDSSTQNTAATGFGFKNRIINGAMMIDQRNSGASQTITGGASTLAFNCDRWQVRSGGANATVQQIATNNTYRMRFTGAASVSVVAAQQSIEALNCVDLAGSTATLSLVASSTSLTSLTLEAYYANTTNTFGTWGSPTVTSIGTQTVTISTTESTVSWSFAVPSAATTGIQIRITSGSLGAAQTLKIGNVQLEKGSTATSFDYRPYGAELALCKRYYWASPITAAQQAIETISTTSGAPITQPLAFIPPMRINNPTVSSPTVSASMGCTTTGVQLGYNGNPSVLICNGAFNVAINNRAYVTFNTGNYTASAEL